MRIRSDSFVDGEQIPPAFAFGQHNPETNVELSDNTSPHLAWTDVPEGAQSLVLVCHDTDVPTKPDDVNQAGRTVPADLPRADFFHWVVVDLPPGEGGVAAGEFSRGVTPRGKNGPDGPGNTRLGLNDYTGWFAGDDDMEGKYFGYDGPCPPWNDEIVHHYHFTLFALDVPRCDVAGEFTGADVRAAIEGHVLARCSITGTYHIYPDAVVRS